MRSIVPSFPGGMPGTGLLLLRISVAASLIAGLGPVADAPGWRQGAALVVAAGLCIGLRTRFLAALCIAVAGVELLLGAGATAAGIIHLAAAAALALTGPGAFAADARLFGRRTVVVPRGDTIV